MGAASGDRSSLAGSGAAAGDLVIADSPVVADDRRLDAIESVVVDAIRTSDQAGPVACAVIDTASPLAYFGRAIEASRFPEYDMAAAMAPFEASSHFLYTVDVEQGLIGHVMRVVRGCSADEMAMTGRTRIEVLDDRLVASDPVEVTSLDEMFGHHGFTDPARAWNISTSCATERVAPTRHRPYSLLTYKGLLLLIQPIQIDHFFAYVNKKTIRSLDRLGIPSNLVAGREFHMPAGDGYDPDYLAIHMQPDEATVRSFTVYNPERPLSRAVAEIPLPVVVFVHEGDQVFDLTDAAVSPHVRLVPDAELVPAGGRGAPDAVLDLTGDDDEVVIDLTDGALSRSTEPPGAISSSRPPGSNV